MSERTEKFTPPVVGKVPPGAPLHEEEKVGKMPSGRTVREIPSEKVSPKEQKSEEVIISRLSQETIASPHEPKKEEHSITQTGEKSPSEERTEKVRQKTLPLARSAEGITSSAGSLTPSIQELVETSLYPDMPLPGQPQGPFTIQERMQALRVPGVSIAVVNNGKLEWYQGYGELQSQGPKVPDSESAVTQLGSIGKMFTSLAVLSLIEENPTWFPEGLDTDVTSILEKDPDLGNDFWKNFDPHGFLKSGHKVTIRLLLSHRAGIVEGASEYYDKQALAQQIDEVQKEVTALKLQIGLSPSSSERESLDPTLRVKQEKLKNLQEIQQKSAQEKIPSINEILEGKTKLGPVFIKCKPGERHEYSNPGFGILQKAVEIVSHKPFLEVVKERVLDKAGMTETTYAPPFERKIHGNEGGSPLPGQWLYIPHPAAGASTWTTARDLAKLIPALQSTFKGENTTIIGNKSAQEMLQIPEPQSDPYALGIEVRKEGGVTFFGHTGGTPGFATRLLADDQGHGVVILTNAEEGRAFIPEVMRSIATAYHWPEWESHPVCQPYARFEEILASPPDLKEWFGSYMFQSSSGNHTVQIHMDGVKTVAEVDGGSGKKGGVTLDLTSVGVKLAYGRKGAQGSYEVIRLGEEHGLKYLNLYGKRYWGSR